MAEKPKAATKTATYQRLAEATSLTRKQVASFFDELSNLIKAEVGKKGPGIFNLPGLLKIKTRREGADQGAPGPQSADRRADHDQGQAQTDRGAGPASEGPQGDGQVAPVLFGAVW